MGNNPDLLVVGAGPTGCTIAQQAATQMGWSSLVIDRRSHIAGLCYDRPHSSGVLIHQFGPHYFRSNNKSLIDYLSKFTDWIPGDYIVKSQVGDQLYPFPINLTTLEKFFDTTLDEKSAHQLLESLKENIPEPQNAEEWVCSKVGRKLYESFYLGYTLKQWNLHPSQLDKSVCGRIPIRLNRDERYVDHQYQLTPKFGFTKMFEKMLSHNLIEVRLGVEYRSAKSMVAPVIGTVYCGAIDEYFGNSLGVLPWRSLEFDFKSYDQEFKQPCVQINYPNDFDYTRSVEIKHVTRQQHPQTVICYEYPRSEGDPYYPVLTAESAELYNAYLRLSIEERERKRVYIAGRLGNFCYINTDQAIERAMILFDEIRQDHQQLTH